jgi:hypothetical protein
MDNNKKFIKKQKIGKKKNFTFQVWPKEVEFG